MYQLPPQTFDKESPACHVSIIRAEHAEAESNIIGLILVAVIAAFAAALCTLIAFSLLERRTGAISAALGALVTGAVSVFLIRQRRNATIRAGDAINDVKAVCSAATVQQLGA